MNDKMTDYRETPQNSTQVEHSVEYETYREQALEMAAEHPIDPSDIDTRRIEYEKIRDARTTANEAYPKLLDHLTTYSKNIASFRSIELYPYNDKKLKRTDFGLTA